ncbi:hypothetical protein MT356_20625 [Rathayibacter festucae]|uniref:hypothetical protein n=1 Tax=Rathayibacter festucae TaxID=110937 RepID=UPI001FB1A7C8|nr:hypothetical protein [Rathayibacter festucae]MCJ1702123.1 hypothetical protein [Rathayibacter festucae]
MTTELFAPVEVIGYRLRRRRTLATYPALGEWETRSGEPGYWLDDNTGHRLWFTVDSTTDLVQSIALSTPDRRPYGGCGA